MAARRQGEGVADNPYTEEPDCADAWLLGWMARTHPFHAGAMTNPREFH